MRGIEVHHNGSMLCAAGTANASLVTVHVNLFVEEPGQGTLRVSGMNELGGDRTSHTYWLEEEPLHGGDRLVFRFTDILSPTPPALETATDSPEYIAEQASYRSELDKRLPELRSIRREWPDGSLSFVVAGGESITATFEGNREFIALSLDWNRWRPEHCRFSVRSFSQAEAAARAGSKEWSIGRLLLNESCEVVLGT